jgi:hypothetical protein
MDIGIVRYTNPFSVNPTMDKQHYDVGVGSKSPRTADRDR